MQLSWVGVSFGIWEITIFERRIFFCCTYSGWFDRFLCVLLHCNATVKRACEYHLEVVDARCMKGWTVERDYFNWINESNEVEPKKPCKSKESFLINPLYQLAQFYPHISVSINLNLKQKICKSTKFQNLLLNSIKNL